MKSRAIRKIVILHFLPLELYPPIMNLLDVASANTDPSVKFTVYSTFNNLHLAEYVQKSDNITIKRIGFKKINSKAMRLLHYLLYYSKTLMSLFSLKPSTVLYYDTISSFPGIIYKRYLNPKTRLFVHYHEYMSKDEYKYGMKMVRFFHELEAKELPNASWISHTNQDRINLYKQDLDPLLLKNSEELPNFPPESWNRIEREKEGEVIRIVQVGSIGLETMYVREFSNWVYVMNGKVIWDIYTFKLDNETADFFKVLNCPWISIKASVDYENLANTLKNYDVGVILYQGHIPNYVYNAPNKLFEYHVCGLDVWYPSHMISASRYQTSKTFPKIIPVDFESMSSDVTAYIDRSDMAYQKINFSATDIYKPFLEKLCS